MELSVEKRFILNLNENEYKFILDYLIRDDIYNYLHPDEAALVDKLESLYNKNRNI